MTLERVSDGRLRLVDCPFCDADLRGRDPATHLRKCDAYREAWGMDVTGSSANGEA